MKEKLLVMALLLCSLGVSAQQNDSTAFRAYLYNKEYDVYMRINFYGQDVVVPGQEFYGQLPGFLSKTHDSFCWLVLSAKMSGNVAELTMINDYGSEDLTATLTCLNDSTYVLRQQDGSTLKVPKDRKWQKLPKELEFKKR